MSIAPEQKAAPANDQGNLPEKAAINGGDPNIIEAQTKNFDPTDISYNINRIDMRKSFYLISFI